MKKLRDYRDGQEDFGLICKKYPDYSEIHLIADNAEYFHAAGVSKLPDEHKKTNILFLGVLLRLSFETYHIIKPLEQRGRLILLRHSPS